MNDPTEGPRRQLMAEINTNATNREALEAKHGQVWNTDELSRDYHVIGFAAPIIAVVRKSDGQKGSLCFQHNPRFYFGFEAHKS